jgi:cell division protein FtsQ
MEPETYPPEVLAEEEPRYLRRQKPVEVRRRKLGGRAWSRYRRGAVAVLAAAALLTGGYWAVDFALNAPHFKLEGVAVRGNQFVAGGAVLEVFSADTGRSVLRIPLDERREALERIAWVERATVRRVLPNRLEVEITERRPVAFLRLGAEMALADAFGVILERPLEAEFNFPVVTGLSESLPLAEREKRMRLYLQFLKEIDLARPGAAEHVSEVDLSEGGDVRATLAGLPELAGGESEEASSVLVYFGGADFHSKYRVFLENIAQWRATAGRVESVDLRFERQVVVNPEARPATQARSAVAGAPAGRTP